MHIGKTEKKTSKKEIIRGRKFNNMRWPKRLKLVPYPISNAGEFIVRDALSWATALCGRMVNSFPRRFYLPSMSHQGTHFQLNEPRAVCETGSNPRR